MKRPNARVIHVLALVASLLLAGCWARPVFNDIWADNQSDRALVITLHFDDGETNYAYSVPAHSRGMLLQGFASVPQRVSLVAADGSNLGVFRPSSELIGVLIDPRGAASIREGEGVPFSDAIEFEMLPPE